MLLHLGKERVSVSRPPNPTRRAPGCQIPVISTNTRSQRATKSYLILPYLRSRQLHSAEAICCTGPMHVPDWTSAQENLLQAVAHRKKSRWSNTT